VTVGEKGQIVIPKKIRDDLKIEKGTQLLISEDKGKITIKPVKMSEAYLMMLLSESSLAKDWLNEDEDKAWQNL
jgi:AbrB family looped-hinge helix DNA binding protein